MPSDNDTEQTTRTIDLTQHRDDTDGESDAVEESDEAADAERGTFYETGTTDQPSPGPEADAQDTEQMSGEGEADATSLREQGISVAQEALSEASAEGRSRRQTVAAAIDSVQGEIEEVSQQISQATQRQQQVDQTRDDLHETRDDLLDAITHDESGEEITGLDRPVFRVREGGIIMGVTEDTVSDELDRLGERLSATEEQAEQIDAVVDELAETRRVRLYALNALREKQRELDSELSADLNI